MAAPIDQLVVVTLGASQADVALTAHFNGGPILITVDNRGDQKSYTFSADPFFRRPDHNISIGSLLFRVIPAADFKPLLITLQFANMFPNDSQPPVTSGTPTVFYHAELTSIDDNTNLKVFDGRLAFNEATSIVIAIKR